MDSSLEKTLNQYEKTSSKLEKSSGKSKAGKADALSSELNQLTASLSSLSPMVYTTYQRLDEERLRGLKEVIVRWGTVRGDLATRDGERSDRAVAALIGWETSDEVVAVGRRLGGAGGSHARTGSAPVLNNTPETRELFLCKRLPLCADNFQLVQSDDYPRLLRSILARAPRIILHVPHLGRTAPSTMSILPLLPFPEASSPCLGGQNRPWVGRVGGEAIVMRHR